MKIAESKNGIIIEVLVKPKSPKFEILLEEDELIVRCTEEPFKGKVNKELLKTLVRFFHTNVEIVSGAASKQKKLLLRNIEKSEVERLLYKVSSERTKPSHKPSSS
jgi:uncharacterized protein (TIGR00251 family)